MSTPRHADHPIDKFFLERWSPRSFEPVDMPDADLMSIFEAARWAPSSFNNQPWRFLYAKRGSAQWPLLFNLMVPFNQSWTADASVLVIVISNTQFDHNGKPADTHSFDAGAAWQNIGSRREKATKNPLDHQGQRGCGVRGPRLGSKTP